MSNVKMSVHEARLIRELKKNCSYRRLAEIYYSPRDHLYGIQMAGEDLCVMACAALGIDRNISYPSGMQVFDEDNRSYIGSFWWWE